MPAPTAGGNPRPTGATAKPKTKKKQVSKKDNQGKQ